MSLPVFDAACASFRFHSGGTGLNGPLQITIANDATVVVGVCCDNFSGSLTFTVSDGTNTYVESAFKSFDTSGQNRVSFFTFKYTGGAGAKNITVTASSGAFGRSYCASFTNCGPIVGADTPLQVTGNNVNPDTGTSATLSQPEMLIVALFSGNVTFWTGSTIPPNTSFLDLYNNSNSSNTPISMSYKIVNNTAAQRADMGTQSNAADHWGALLLMIPGAAGGAKKYGGGMSGGVNNLNGGLA